MTVPDEPHFPAPGEKITDPYREPERPAPSPPSHKIVTRAEPPPSSTPRPKHLALTDEEKKALLTVTMARAPVWRGPLTRSPIFIVTSILSVVAKTVLGSWALAFDIVIFAAALLWVARPLFKRDRFS